MVLRFREGKHLKALSTELGSLLAGTFITTMFMLVAHQQYGPFSNTCTNIHCKHKFFIQFWGSPRECAGLWKFGPHSVSVTYPSVILISFKAFSRDRRITQHVKLPSLMTRVVTIILNVGNPSWCQQLKLACLIIPSWLWIYILMNGICLQGPCRRFKIWQSG